MKIVSKIESQKPLFLKKKEGEGEREEESQRQKEKIGRKSE